jgi:NAD(P)-dependent dehydrogenase (short-subunit alcohol dehydrogenase family)
MRTIVTGAGSGIGWATARALATLPGARIFLVDRNEARRTENAGTLTALGAEVAGLGGDITDRAFPAAIVTSAVEAFGGIDAIVSSAGSIANAAPMSELPLETFEAAFAINTRPTFLLAQAAYPHLKASRGAIVAVTSVGARHPAAMLGGYSPSKAALTMLIRQLALEWGPDGIRANCVSPGPTATPMAAVYADPAIRAARASTLPLRRIAEAEQVAATILFLLGPGAAGITGVELDVDCGMGVTTLELSGAALNRPQS